MEKTMNKNKTMGHLIILVSVIFMFSRGVNMLMKNGDPKEAAVWMATAVFIQLLILMTEPLNVEDKEELE